MNVRGRRRLQQALSARYPWVADTEVGPAAVEAGECDRCGSEARLVMTCGPGAHLYLGRRCAGELGPSAWCAGHADAAAIAVTTLQTLPAEADTVARLWWVATGEVVMDPSLEAEARHVQIATGA